MPSINGLRAWLETGTTLKVPEFKPSTSGEASASSHIAARPGEAFCLRYDHVPVEGYDLAWRLRISGSDGQNAIEQWGGPPMEMRRAKGIVKVRAMRMSEDGSTFRAFAWSDDADDEVALTGTIVLSLHLCHFAEATSEVPKSKSPTKSTAAETAEAAHPLLAPPVTKPTASKLWTWYWRDEQPQMTFVFNYGKKEALQALGIIPGANKSETLSKFQPNNHSHHSAPLKSPMQAAKGIFGHKPRISSGALMGVPPRELIKHQQRMRMSDMWRKRGLSTSSTESDVSDASSEDSFSRNAEHQEGLSYLHD